MPRHGGATAHMNNFDLILKPVITEKATANEKEGKYQFFVRKHATKIDIRAAFEKLYGIDVVKVNAMRTAGKTRMGKTRRATTKKREYKKIIITTKGRKTIDVLKPKLKI